MTTKLVQQLKDEKILDEFFSKSRIHKALVNRSSSLLKLLIIQKVITEDELAGSGTTAVLMKLFILSSTV